ncbi:MAG: hypothetical protein IIA50_02560 [Bacteroidetes bacterium]|nr:hypothetical protein [Bacteroidota bacterium]
MAGNNSFQVLITDSVHPICRQLLEEAGFTPVVATGKTVAELKPLVAEADGWIIRSGTKITPELIDVADRLTVIGRAGVGVDNVDIPAATECGIMVANAPDGNTVTTCEHAISLMMSLARNIPAGDATMHDGKWDKKNLSGIELYGKTLGIVGLGKIGQAVAHRMQAFGMTIWGFDPYVSREVAQKILNFC